MESKNKGKGFINWTANHGNLIETLNDQIKHLTKDLEDLESQYEINRKNINDQLEEKIKCRDDIVMSIRKNKENEFLKKYGKIKSQGHTLFELCKDRTIFKNTDLDDQYLYYEKILEIDPNFDAAKDTIVCKSHEYHQFDHILYNGNKMLLGVRYYKSTPETLKSSIYKIINNDINNIINL